jgi:hypothetical protein
MYSENRMPGALAMMKARDIAISVHHVDARNAHWCRVEFFFDKGGDASAAYRAVERLYEMDRPPLLHEDRTQG